jgi:hypothetical protein
MRKIVIPKVFHILFRGFWVAVYTFRWIFLKRSFQGVGRLIFIQQFYRWCTVVDTGDKLFEDVIVTGNKLIPVVMESMQIQDKA